MLQDICCLLHHQALTKSTPNTTLPYTHLVDLVSNDDQVVRLSKAHHILLVGPAEALACGVAGVDDHHTAHTQA